MFRRLIIRWFSHTSEDRRNQFLNLIWNLAGYWSSFIDEAQWNWMAMWCTLWICFRIWTVPEVCNVTFVSSHRNNQRWRIILRVHAVQDIKYTVVNVTQKIFGNATSDFTIFGAIKKLKIILNYFFFDSALNYYPSTRITN